MAGGAPQTEMPSSDVREQIERFENSAEADPSLSSRLQDELGLSPDEAGDILSINNESLAGELKSELLDASRDGAKAVIKAGLLVGAATLAPWAAAGIGIAYGGYKTIKAVKEHGVKDTIKGIFSKKTLKNITAFTLGGAIGATIGILPSIGLRAGAAAWEAGRKARKRRELQSLLERFKNNEESLTEEERQSFSALVQSYNSVGAVSGFFRATANAAMLGSFSFYGKDALQDIGRSASEHLPEPVTNLAGTAGTKASELAHGAYNTLDGHVSEIAASDPTHLANALGHGYSAVQSLPLNMQPVIRILLTTI